MDNHYTVLRDRWLRSGIRRVRPEQIEEWWPGSPRKASLICSTLRRMGQPIDTIKKQGVVQAYELETIPLHQPRRIT